MTGPGHRTKSLRNSPLRGGQEPRARSEPREDSNSGWQGHAAINKPTVWCNVLHTIKRSKMTREPAPDAAKDIGPLLGMTKLALTNSANQVA